MTIQPTQSDNLLKGPALITAIDQALAGNNLERGVQYGLALARRILCGWNSYRHGSEERRALFRTTNTVDQTLDKHKKEIEKAPGGAKAYARALLAGTAVSPSLLFRRPHDTWVGGWPGLPPFANERYFTLLNTLHKNLLPLPTKESLYTHTNQQITKFYSKVVILKACCSGELYPLSFAAFCEAEAGCTRGYGHIVCRNSLKKGVTLYLTKAWQEAQPAVLKNRQICAGVVQAVQTALKELRALAQLNAPDWPSERLITEEDLNAIDDALMQENLNTIDALTQEGLDAIDDALMQEDLDMINALIQESPPPSPTSETAVTPNTPSTLASSPIISPPSNVTVSSAASPDDAAVWRLQAQELGPIRVLAEGTYLELANLQKKLAGAAQKELEDLATSRVFLEGLERTLEILREWQRKHPESHRGAVDQEAQHYLKKAVKLSTQLRDAQEEAFFAQLRPFILKENTCVMRNDASLSSPLTLNNSPSFNE
jgi:hypothetical protein